MASHPARRQLSSSEWEDHRRLRVLKPTRLLAVVAACGVVYVVFCSPVFDVRDVEVTAPASLRGMVMRLAPVGQNIFATRTEALERELCRDLRVESASVRRAYPNRLRIQVWPRVAVAYAVVEGQKLLVDREGLVFDRGPDRPQVPLLTAPAPGIGGWLDAQHMRLANECLEGAARYGLPRVLKIDFIPPIVPQSQEDGCLPGAINMLLEGGALIKLGAPERLGDKLCLAPDVLRRHGVENIEYIDVSLLECPVYRLREGRQPGPRESQGEMARVGGSDERA